METTGLNTCHADYLRRSQFHTMTAEKTTVTDSGHILIPAEIRQQLDIDAGDTLRWAVADDDSLSVEVVAQEYGAFDDFEPVSMGGTGTESHDLAGNETNSATIDPE
jgi:AbrB family looped-hinge helix DNA binding protein